MFKNKSLLLLIAIVFLSAFSRLYRLDLNPPSLYSDEVDIGYQVKSLFTTGKDYQGYTLPLQFHSFSDVRTSLPIYATALVSLVPGVSLDLAIRLTPAIFSLLSLITIYFLTNNLFTLFKIKKENSLLEPGIWASLSLSLLPWHYTYSRIGFELSMLFFFVVFGLFLYTRFLQNKNKTLLVLSLVVLSLVPMVYSTAKLSIIFYPLILFLLPGGYEFFKIKKNWVYLLILFIPLGVLFLNGGANKRFSEISVFTDPTISTEIDIIRQTDLGSNPPVGSAPDLNTKIVHNKFVFVVNTLTKNLINPISGGFLFLQGDENQRHAVTGWGMLEKTLIIPLLLGFYFLVSEKHKRFLALLAILWVSATTPAALTRDGFNHASRNFMMILPLVLLISTGFHHLLKSSKLLTVLLTVLLLIESALYFHDYWYHYQYDSQRDWNYGLRQVIQETNKYPDKPIIITRNYEPPLIYYLYYADFPPAKFQEMYQTNTFLEKVDQKLNIEGVRLTGTDVYFASVIDKELANPFLIKNGVYVLTRNEYLETNEPNHSLIETVKFPTGLPVFYILDTNKL